MAEPDIPDLFQLVGPPIVEDPGTIYDYDASVGEAWSGGVDRTLDTNPATAVIRNYQFLSEGLKGIVGETEWVDQAKARAEAAEAQVTIDVPEAGISRYELNALKYLKRREAEQNMIAERTRGFAASAAGFAGGLAASLTDPINIGSAFIPVVGQARYAAWLRAAGSPLGRAGVRAGTGALEGAVGAAAIEPLVFAGAQAGQLDYTAADSFLNIAFGTILGGGLHSIGGAVADLALPSRLRDYAGLAPDQVKLDALQRSVRALEDDRAVNAESAFFAEAQRRNGVTDAEFLSRAPDFDEEALRDARATVVMGRAGEDETITTPSLLQVIKRLGGIKVRDDQGALTREGAEIMAVLQDVRYPGLINNKSGRPPDSVLEALTEDGWFQSRDRGQTDLAEMYDMIDRAARGERVQPFGDLPPVRLKKTAEAELEAAGITKADSVAAASVKLAEYRQGLQRDRFLDDPDFEPDEIVWREPGEEDPLAGPVSDEMLARFERVEGIDNWEVEQSTFSRMADEAVSRGEADLAQVADDVNFVDAQIDGLKARGMWSSADEAALQAGEVKARDLENKAALYRAAAVCMME
jgi:hypothetical protein